MPDSNDFVKIGEFKELKDKFYEQQIEQRIRNKDYDRKHEETMTAIANLTSATADVVDAWKVANGLQRFVKWLSGFAVIGAVMAYFATQFPQLFK
jgi:hypothetical protein